MTGRQVVWRGPVQRASGLGIASREYVFALKRQGVHVTLGDSGYWNGVPQKNKALIYHQLPGKLDMVKERARFGRILLNTVWETTRIPQSWLPKINKFDAVCVPSRQNKAALQNSGVRIPIYVVPHGVHTEVYKPENKKYPMPMANGRFVFVSVFGFQHRKNPEALLRAYWEEFSSNDNVILVIKTNGYDKFESGQWILNQMLNYKKRLGIRKKTAPIVVITKRLSPGQMKGLYTLGNVFVLPTRGEGVGMPFMESLASGVPVIATGWGGHMDFLNERNAFFIKYRLQSPQISMNSRHAIARSFRSLFSGYGQYWAEPDLSSLKAQMRLAYRQPQLCKKKGLQGRLDMKKFSWSRAGAMLKKVVEMG